MPGYGGRIPAYDDMVNMCIALKMEENTLTLAEACRRVNAEHPRRVGLIESTLRKRVNALTGVNWNDLRDDTEEESAEALLGLAQMEAAATTDESNVNPLQTLLSNMTTWTAQSVNAGPELQKQQKEVLDALAAAIKDTQAQQQTLVTPPQFAE
jgi:tRNA U34 5-carboxymethylaminomethyl modifying GTPase MnmE/TrmE